MTTPRHQVPLTDTEAMRQIHALLDNTEWDAETIEHVAELVQRTGRTIRFDDEAVSVNERLEALRIEADARDATEQAR